MFRKILSALGMGAESPGQPHSPPAEPSEPPLPIEQHRSIRRDLAAEPPRPGVPKDASRAMRIRPYGDETCNFIYNLLFCDIPALFQGSGEPSLTDMLFVPGADAGVLRAIANDAATYDSRYRALAFNRLREMGETVPSRLLLGTILEVPVNGGLDTLAAFEDGGVRYINHTEKMSIFAGRGHPLDAHVDRLLAASQAVVDQIGPWTEARLPPPPPDEIRITFLVSDGLYFGQGEYGVLASDEFGGPVVASSLALLQAIIDHQQPA